MSKAIFSIIFAISGISYSQESMLNLDARKDRGIDSMVFVDAVNYKIQLKFAKAVSISLPYHTSPDSIETFYVAGNWISRTYENYFRDYCSVHVNGFWGNELYIPEGQTFTVTGAHDGAQAPWATSRASTLILDIHGAVTQPSTGFPYVFCVKSGNLRPTISDLESFFGGRIDAYSLLEPPNP